MTQATVSGSSLWTTFSISYTAEKKVLAARQSIYKAMFDSRREGNLARCATLSELVAMLSKLEGQIKIIAITVLRMETTTSEERWLSEENEATWHGLLVQFLAAPLYLRSLILCQTSLFDTIEGFESFRRRLEVLESEISRQVGRWRCLTGLANFTGAKFFFGLVRSPSSRDAAGTSWRGPRVTLDDWGPRGSIQGSQK